jgi:hypothetical protein
MRRAIALLTSAVFITACSHAVVIDTDPSGAE